MPLECSLCKHPLRQDIDRALIEGATVRDIAGRFGLSKSPVHRHGIHIARALTDAEKAKATRALEHSDWVTRKLRKVAEKCESQPRQFLLAADSLVRAINVHGRITGEIRPGDVNVVQAAQVSVDHLDVERRAVDFLRLRGWVLTPPGAQAG